MTGTRPDLDFTSKEEFRQVCQYLSARLHYLNRTALGESGFAWEVADVLARVAQVFEQGLDDEAVGKLFGDGWTEGTLPGGERHAALMALLYTDKTG